MKKVSIFFSIVLLVWGCEPKPEASKLIDELIVSTNYDTEANFSSYSTYAIATDTIGFYSNGSKDTIIVQRESDLPRPVLETIQTNMNARGYAKVDRNQNPDLGINVSVINDFNAFQQIVYPGGYGGYGGYYYPDYYGYSSYYYPYINTYVSNTGILMIEILDLKNRLANNSVKAIWTANMGDIYSTINLVKQSTDATNQAFVQSPYLQK